MKYIKTFFYKINEAKDYYQQNLRKMANKIWAIRRLGGKCIKCGEKNIFKLAFHHHGEIEKEAEISILLLHNKEIIKNEVDKCVLLCNNCHSNEHNYNTNKLTVSLIRKKVYLEYKQGKDPNNWHCEHPNHKNLIKYDNISIFDFHHRNLHGKDEIEENLKKFNLSSNRVPLIRNVDNLPDYIKKELDKCVVYCKNCHQYQHALERGKVQFVIDNNEEIENYILNPIKIMDTREKQLQKKAEITQYIKSNKNKLSKNEIAKNASELFNILPHSVYRYYIELYPEERGNLNPNHKEDIINYIKKYHDKLSKIDIVNRLNNMYGISKSIIYSYHKELYPEESFNQLSNDILNNVDNFIKNNHGKLSKKEIINKLIDIFNLTYDSANWRYKKIYPDEKKIYKTKEVIDYIKNNHDKLSRKEIADNIFNIFGIKSGMVYKYYNRLYPNE